LPRAQPNPPIEKEILQFLSNSNLFRSAPSCHTAGANFAPRSFSM
jgi:hypothetical protein